MAKTKQSEQEEKSSSISRDIILLIVGALISFVSSISTSYVDNIYQDKKDIRLKKYTVVEQLSRDIGLRLIVTNELHRAKAIVSVDKQKTLDSALKKYIAIQERFNSMNNVYMVQIGKFFSEDDRRFYIDSIHDPLINLGKFCKDNDTTKVKEKTYSKYYGKVDTAFNKLINKIYRSID